MPFILQSLSKAVEALRCKNNNQKRFSHRPLILVVGSRLHSWLAPKKAMTSNLMIAITIVLSIKKKKLAAVFWNRIRSWRMKNKEQFLWNAMYLSSATSPRHWQQLLQLTESKCRGELASPWHVSPSQTPKSRRKKAGKNAPWPTWKDFKLSAVR